MRKNYWIRRPLTEVKWVLWNLQLCTIRPCLLDIFTTIALIAFKWGTELSIISMGIRIIPVVERFKKKERKICTNFFEVNWEGQKFWLDISDALRAKILFGVHIIHAFSVPFESSQNLVGKGEVAISYCMTLSWKELILL